MHGRKAAARARVALPMHALERLGLRPRAFGVVLHDQRDAELTRPFIDALFRLGERFGRDVLGVARQQGVVRGLRLLLPHRVHADDREDDIIAAARHLAKVVAEARHSARLVVERALLLEDAEEHELHRRESSRVEPSASPTMTFHVKERNSPFSTTPAMLLRSRSSEWGAGMPCSNRMSRTRLPLSVTKGFPSFVRSVAARPFTASLRFTTSTPKGSTSTGRGERVPRRSTIFEGSTTMIWRRVMDATTFSRKSAPPRPLIRS